MMKNHCWIRASGSDISGQSPQPRSEHTAVNIGKSKIVFFGGLADKKFLNDVTVYDIENNMWYQPECSGYGSDDGNVGPCPRAFHIAIPVDCHMFVFGGRYGANRLGDFWVLDTDLWQWSELTSFGDLPSPRDFAAASAIGNQKIVMFGGWDGKKWLSDVFIMDTISLEWMELPVSGPVPSPRCGHSVSMIEKRLLMYGGRGGGGPIMADLWALKGLIKDENEAPGWTQLKLPGHAPPPLCGHTMTSGGTHLLLFGGHGTGGWLSRYDIYYNDCVVLDRVSVQWKVLPTSNEPPAARAYHSMNSVGSRYLLFGGFDGKTTYGDLWWLVPEDDPLARRSSQSPSEVVPEYNLSTGSKEAIETESPVSTLQKRLQIPLIPSTHHIENELEDNELVRLASQICKDQNLSNVQAVQAIRDHWLNSAPKSITLKELSPLLRDYQRLITTHQIGKNWCNLELEEGRFPGKSTFRFYHVRDASHLRLNDIPTLLAEYRKLLSSESKDR